MNEQTTEQVQVQPEAVVSEPVQSEPSQPEVSVADWKSQLAEDLREHKALAQYKDINGVAKSLLHAQHLLGKRFDELSPDELDSYYTKLGRPEQADGYKIEVPENANPEGIQWYKNLAHKAGLTEKQAKEVFGEYMNFENQIREQHMANLQKARDDSIASLKSEFGAGFEKQLSFAKRAVQEYGGEDLKAALDQTGLGDNPALVKAFARIGKELTESNLAVGSNPAQFGLTPSEAQNKINTLLNDPNFKKRYYNAHVQGHKEAVKEIQELYKLKSNS